MNEVLAGTRPAHRVGFLANEVGLHIHPEHHWLGVSPDGLVDAVDPATAP